MPNRLQNKQTISNMFKNFGLLDLSFLREHDFKILEFSENAKMTITDLLSNFGGVLGLMLGISFLSFVESIEKT